MPFRLTMQYCPGMPICSNHKIIKDRRTRPTGTNHKHWAIVCESIWYTYVLIVAIVQGISVLLYACFCLRMRASVSNPVAVRNVNGRLRKGAASSYVVSAPQPATASTAAAFRAANAARSRFKVNKKFHKLLTITRRRSAWSTYTYKCTTDTDTQLSIRTASTLALTDQHSHSHILHITIVVIIIITINTWSRVKQTFRRCRWRTWRLCIEQNVSPSSRNWICDDLPQSMWEREKELRTLRSSHVQNQENDDDDADSQFAVAQVGQALQIFVRNPNDRSKKDARSHAFVYIFTRIFYILYSIVYTYS